MPTILFAYLIIVFLFVVYSAIAIYHLMRYGYSGDLSKLISVLYLIVAGAIILVTFLILIPLTLMS